MANRLLSGKAPDEIVICSMSFASVLESGETVSGHSCAISLYVGSTAASGMSVGGTSLASNIVSQTVQGGLEAHVYRLRYSVATSLGRTLIASSYLPIDEDD